MISTKVFRTKLDEVKTLEYFDRPILPENEPVFNVFLNTRTIEVPKDFQEIATEGEHLAETIWFTLDRYFDGQDLAQPEKKWAVQYVNALGEENLVPMTYKILGSHGLDLNPDADTNTKPSENNDTSTLTLGWDIHYDITKKAGAVSIALRCFEQAKDAKGNPIDEIIYNLSTKTVTLRVADSLNITDQDNVNLMNPPRDLLSHLVQKIDDLYSNNTLVGFKYSDLDENSLPQINGVRLIGNTPSEYLNIKYNDLQEKPTITVDGVKYTIGGEEEIVVSKITVDSALDEDSSNPVQNSIIANKIKAIEEKLGTMSYIPVEISDFTVDKKYAEVGTTLNETVTFSWTAKGNIKSQQIFIGTELITGTLTDKGNNSYTFTYSLKDSPISTNTEFTLKVTDFAEKVASATTSITFTNKVFYGVGKTFDFSKMQSNLQETKNTVFNVTAEKDEYIYFAAPSKYKVSANSFSVGGFTGGFHFVETSDDYNGTNYDVWQSDNKTLGDVTVVVA